MQIIFDFSHEEAIDRILTERIDVDGPGACVGILHNGEFVYRKCFGLANLEHTLSLTSDTPMYLASVAKQFTAACVALLIEEGRIALDDPILHYLPELPAYCAAIKIRHLLGHQSGLRDYLWLRLLTGDPLQRYSNIAEAIYQLQRQRGLEFVPGVDYCYCNSGYILLSEIVTRLTGSIRRFADERIFRPLGMTHTLFHDRGFEVIPGVALSYQKEDIGFTELSVVSEIVGDGGVYSTLNDLARWDENFYSHKVGRERFHELMASRIDYDDGRRSDYGFGLLQDVPFLPRPSFFHNGGLFHYRTFMVRFPESHLSLVILCNCTLPTELLAQKIVAHVIEESASVPESPFTRLPICEEEAQAYAGTYWNDRACAKLSFSCEEGRLYLGQAATGLELHRIGERCYSFQDASNSVFIVEFRDAPRRMLLTQNNGIPVEFLEHPWVAPDSEALQRLAGRYWSEELESAYDLRWEDGNLNGYCRGQKLGTLQPGYENMFSMTIATSEVEVWFHFSDQDSTSFYISCKMLNKIEFIRV